MSNKRGSHPKVSSVSHESIRTHDRAQARARMHQRATLPPSHTHAFTQIRTKTHKNSDLHEPLHLVCGQIDARLSRLCDLCGLAKFSCNAFPLPNVIPARRSDTDDEPGTRADSRATASCPRRQAYADRYRFSWHPREEKDGQVMTDCGSLRSSCAGGKRARFKAPPPPLACRARWVQWTGGCKSWRCPFWQRCSQPGRFCCRSQRSLVYTAAEAPWQPCGGVVCRGVGAKLIFHCACLGNPTVRRPVWWQHGMAMMSLPESWPMP